MHLIDDKCEDNISLVEFYVSFIKECRKEYHSTRRCIHIHVLWNHHCSWGFNVREGTLPFPRGDDNEIAKIH